jgi:hypothetical protein
MNTTQLFLLLLLVFICYCHEPETAAETEYEEPQEQVQLPTRNPAAGRPPPAYVPPPDTSGIDYSVPATPQPPPKNNEPSDEGQYHPAAVEEHQETVPVNYPTMVPQTIATESGHANLVHIPPNRLTPRDPDNYDYGNVRYRYTGPETLLKGKERFYAKSGTFKTWIRFKALPKSPTACHTGQEDTLMGYKKYFEALELKNSADVALALGYTQYYDDFLPKYRVLYRTAKSDIATGMESLYKSCSFEELVCFLANVAKWRKIQYKLMLKSLMKKAGNVNSDKMQKAYIGRVKYIEKKMGLLATRLDERNQMITNIEIQCPAVDFLTVSN